MASKTKKNAVYAQSGGVTAVINASAYGVIKAARASGFIGELFCGYDGINGVLEEKLIDLGQESPATIEALRYTPAGAFGTARRKLQDLEKDRAHFERIVKVCEAHDIQYFFYNGGNDSMDTVHKLSLFAKSQGSPLQVLGVPKTIDNDLPITDNSPGFGSVAKYNAVSMMEASLDTEAMSRDSTKVFVMEAMGRHAGWIAASTGLASRTEKEGPHLILLPEVPFDEAKFLAAVESTVKKLGFCSVTVSEGVQNAEGKFLAEMGGHDAFGHAQLGGAGNIIQELVKQKLKLKVHGANLDYCQRSARHVASAVDVQQAIACGERAVALAGEGLSGQMVTIQRDGEKPYKWSLGHTGAGNIANQEKMIPKDFIREDGYHITDKFRRYCLPLIEGEDYPPYQNGLPAYARLKKALVPAKLPKYVG
jgi:6-phosphofructokinase 1